MLCDPARSFARHRGGLALAFLMLSALTSPRMVRGENALPGYDIISLGRGHNNILCLAATIAGKKGLLQLDTGASFTVLNEATYRALMPTAGHDLPAKVPKTISINGTQSPVGMATDFHLGTSTFPPLPVALVPGRYLYSSTLERSGGGERLYDGLLGENILRHLNAVVDCGRLRLFLNVDPKKKLSFDGGFVSAGWTRVPMSDIGNNFAVPCVINGQRFRMVVDTGAPFTVASRKLLDKAQVNQRDVPGLTGGLIGTRAEESSFVSLPILRVGSYTATNVHLLSAEQSFTAFGGPQDASSDGPIIGLLGSDNLAANSAVIDIGNKTLYLKRPSAGSG